jgi:hypothetical protein
MTDPSLEKRTRNAVKKITQEICDPLLFLPDEMEMGRLPNRDGVCTLRMTLVWCGEGGPPEKNKGVKANEACSSA